MYGTLSVAVCPRLMDTDEKSMKKKKTENDFKQYDYIGRIFQTNTFLLSIYYVVF